MRFLAETTHELVSGDLQCTFRVFEIKFLTFTVRCYKQSTCSIPFRYHSTILVANNLLSLFHIALSFKNIMVERYIGHFAASFTLALTIAHPKADLLNIVPWYYSFA